MVCLSYVSLLVRCRLAWLQVITFLGEVEVLHQMLLIQCRLGVVTHSGDLGRCHGCWGGSGNDGLLLLGSGDTVVGGGVEGREGIEARVLLKDTQTGRSVVSELKIGPE